MELEVKSKHGQHFILTQLKLLSLEWLRMENGSKYRCQATKKQKKHQVVQTSVSYRMSSKEEESDEKRSQLLEDVTDL